MMLLLQSAGPTPEAVDRVLARVLARPEFAAAHEPSWRAALRRLGTWILDRLIDLLRWLFPRLAESASAWGPYTRAALYVLAALGLLLLGYVGFLVYRGLRRRRARRVQAPQPAPPLTAAGWETRARAAAAAGLWREAAVALYQAVLHRLEERGAVRLDPAKTPGDYRREARRDPEVGPGLDGFLRLFEPLAFGPGPGEAGAYARLRGLAEPLGSHG